MKKLKRIETNHKRELYWAETELPVTEGEQQELEIVQILPEIEEQVMEGFGGAFTESSAYNYNRLSRQDQQAFMEDYFGKQGLCYNAGRITINSCDFSLGNYVYVEDEDRKLDTFSLAHDEKEIIPMIREAMDVCDEKMKFLASPWSPPAYMKTNREMVHGGKLKEEDYRLWADYMVRFIREYQKEGISVSAITVQNEPAAVQTWDSCIYTAEEEGRFVAQALGPALKEAGLSEVELYVWDHNKERLYQRYRDTVEVEGSRQYITGAALHWYTGDHFDAVSAVRKKYPDAKLIFTEGCVEYSRFSDSDEIRKAEMYAHDMIGNFRAGVSLFLDWNLLLDEKGGPNYVGNFCASPVMLRDLGGYEKKLSYYYIGHFSRYLPAGSRRVVTTQYTDALDTCGFVTPDGERIMVILNKTEEDQHIFLREEQGMAEDTVAAHSMVTYVIS